MLRFVVVWIVALLVVQELGRADCLWSSSRFPLRQGQMQGPHLAIVLGLDHVILMPRQPYSLVRNSSTLEVYRRVDQS